MPTKEELEQRNKELEAKINDLERRKGEFREALQAIAAPKLHMNNYLERQKALAKEVAREPRDHTTLLKLVAQAALEYDDIPF